MAETNGKSKIIWYLIALLQTIIGAWVWKMDTRVDAATLKVATLDANYSNIMTELKDVKSDVRSILRKMK